MPNSARRSVSRIVLRYWAADHLAARLLAGPWTRVGIAAALDDLFGSLHYRRRGALITRLTAWGEDRYPPAHPEIAAFLVGSKHFWPSKHRAIPAVLDPPLFAPAPPFAGLRIPALVTTTELADWLRLSPNQLDWLSDELRTHGRANASPLQHYRYSFVPKRAGTPRLLEAPKPRLKAIQRRILHEILDAVPVHPRAHGFVRGRSCLTGAQAHASEAVIATFDLAHFFPAIGAPRINGLFRLLGYPWPVARRLTGLCTTATPASVFDALPFAERPSWEVIDMHGVPHLPQGAPTSPALANLIAWRLDQRLHGLARAADATYTRYADDLAFSGDNVFAKALGRLGKAVERTAAEEGFALNAAKTRIMPRTGRQSVTGVVVNAHCNVDRRDFDALKATLFNCARDTPETQNYDTAADFRARLDGRVTWVEQINPSRGSKLRAIFDRIAWTE